jgi:alpha-L-rhamnosidase
LGRRVSSCACIAVLLGCASALQAQADLHTLETTFQSPPDDARVMMRWWWFGPAVTKPELTRELEQMKAAGFGGFEIQPVYPLELDDAKTGFRNLAYLSDEFLDDVRFVNTQAHSLGLRASLTLSSGWPYGGPHTPITEAAGRLRVVRTPAPQGTRSVAVPYLSNGENLIGVFLANVGWGKGYAEQLPAMLPLPATKSLRLTLPAGKASDSHVVLWFISSRTGQQVKRPAVDADGFVLDHFSREAVEDHLHDVADKLMTAFGDQPPYSVFSDSLEVYGADWTPGLLEQFRQRRGYDLLPHLPELITFAPNEKALAVRHDWGETLTELIDENYLKPIDTWAAAHHTLFRSQTYGDPAVSLASNALVDLPEGEGPQWRQFSYTRWATSASHVYGRPITSSETWTWLHSPAFRATPLDIKTEADRFFLQGINQLIGHGWPYSPPSAGEPGWRFYAAGAFNAHNPWWIVIPDVTRYLQRVSWILRQGEPANQVAVYLPEDDAWAAFTPGKVALTELMPRWITPALTQAIEDGGYNFDYIDSAAIAARGIHYPVMILPDVDRISPATLARIAEYLQHGGKVIAVGRLPAHAPGLQEGMQASAQVAATAAALFNTPGGNAQFIRNAAQLEQSLQHTLPPDMQLTTSLPEPALGFIHRRLAGADIYFVANTGNTPVHTKAHFGAAHGSGEWLDADTGEAREIKMSGSEVELDLAPYESRIVLLHDSIGTGVAASVGEGAAGSSQIVADLSRGWQVRFDGNGIEEQMAELTSWTKKAETLYYSGVASYRRTIELPPSYPRNSRLILSFGVGKPLPEPPGSADHPGMRALLDPPVRDAAVIYVNGERAGSLWHAPYELDITSLLKPGKNALEVRVANTAINLLSGEALPDYQLLSARYGRRFDPQDMNNLQPLPSGLLGKVELISRSAQ